MSAETPAVPGQLARRRQQFRAWRGTRPFWAGLFVLLGGFPIMYFPYAHLQIGHLTLAMATTAGAGSLIIGVLLVVLGLSLWFQKHIRTFAGVAAILLGLVSLPVSNFGGFLVGFLLALFGGAMAVAWAPGVAPEDEKQPVAESGAAAGSTTEDMATSGAPAPSDGSGAGEANDLSGTIPANGTNGRHSAG
ncbi:hypothetical protein GCM10010358_06470 [Streptomyces minutiscleroticus]|uniref:Integral membrane protein n=1 Tax=Streptomyces minutiscleroticus TaxID=68238 RepID=A0A918NBD8_9ACTN|nr:DUF6114 domain-containing protein [Streptomyces minutiscleroticus]GGX55381.1 hypothetical protein GCM10010358_06470 [Streptomyces minutiscleroticus]